MARRKPQSPAKIKYDKSHPIVSIRLSPDLKTKLEAIKKMSNKSVADILEEAVGLQAQSAKAAYANGHLMAQMKYLVTYPCSVCGGTLEITTQEEKNAVAQYMKELGWRHASCSQQ